MNIVDKLLALDTGKLELPSKEVEIKRLTALFDDGEKAVFLCRAISADIYSDIQKMAVETKKGQVRDIDTTRLKYQTLVEGVMQPSFKDKNLQAYYGCSTANELINKLLLPGEQDELLITINELSGYDSNEEVEEEIKN